MAAMRAQQQALAAKAQTEERTKTAELEEALVRSRQREQELTRQVQEEKRKQLIQKLGDQVAAMQAQHHALATKLQAQERAKTAALEPALERSRQRAQELTRQVLEAAENEKSLTPGLPPPACSCPAYVHDARGGNGKAWKRTHRCSTGKVARVREQSRVIS